MARKLTLRVTRTERDPRHGHGQTFNTRLATLDPRKEQAQQILNERQRERGGAALRGQKAAYEREQVERGILEGERLLEAAARGAAEAAQRVYASLPMPSAVRDAGGIGVKARKYGSTWRVEVFGGPEAQKWARIFESGSSAIDLTNVARLSRKRRAVQIYRSGKNGRTTLRSGEEGKPGYFMIMPLVYGRGTVRHDGKIDITDVIARKKYNARGAQVDATISSADERALRQRVAQELEGQHDFQNELTDDPLHEYADKKGWQRGGENAAGAARFDLDADGDPVQRREDTLKPGRMVRRDPNGNNVGWTAPRFKLDAPERLKDAGGGKFMATRATWGWDEDGRPKRTETLVPTTPDDGFETKESAKLTRKAGGFIQLRPDAGQQGSVEKSGNILRFRTVSTRGKTPPKPIPARPGYHVLDQAQQAYRALVGDAIDALRARPKAGGKLSVAQEAALRVLEGGRG